MRLYTCPRPTASAARACSMDRSRNPHTMPDVSLYRLSEWTVAQAAEVLHVTPTTIRRWIAEGHLPVVPQSSPLRVKSHPLNETVRKRMRDGIHRPRSYVPEGIGRYAAWHHFLDEFVWLIKAAYSDVEDLKRKRFRLDVLYSRYLRANDVTPRVLRRDFGFTAKSVPDGVWQDLSRGWYNEFAFNFPAKTATLGLSFSDIRENEKVTESRFLFPSWRIVTAYYSVYFYLRALARLQQPSFRLQEHNATIVNFKACVLSPLSRHAWRFPFDLEYNPQLPRQALPPALSLRPLRFAYSHHPREPHRSPSQIARRVVSEFRRRGESGSNPVRFTLFDYLRDFRVWANYLEIEHLMNLRGSGYKAFLDQNLSAVVFFIGGIAECVVLAATSPIRYFNRAQRFYDLLADASREYESRLRSFPMSQRVEIMHQLSWLPRTLRYREYDDPNRVRTE